MKFIIGSLSERKINIAKEVIKELFNNEKIEVFGYPAISRVPDTPYGKQTFNGAKNRALDSMKHVEGADYYIGLESGLIERYGHIYEEAWAAIFDKNRKEFFGYSSGLKVPDYILRKMDELKLEHCDVMTILEKEHGNLPNDTWGTYSGGIIMREISLKESLRNAFIQIISDENSFYKK
jgi:inosine/xanthosine triphosphatase